MLRSRRDAWPRREHMDKVDSTWMEREGKIELGNKWMMAVGRQAWISILGQARWRWYPSDPRRDIHPRLRFNVSPAVHSLLALSSIAIIHPPLTKPESIQSRAKSTESVKVALIIILSRLTAVLGPIGYTYIYTLTRTQTKEINRRICRKRSNSVFCTIHPLPTKQKLHA